MRRDGRISRALFSVVARYLLLLACGMECGRCNRETCLALVSLKETLMPCYLLDSSSFLPSSSLDWNCHCPFVARHSFTFCYCRLVHCHHPRDSASLFRLCILSVAPPLS
ncbi:hypothetical protein LY76DRAFT_388571 [Colletotrichum caudatum]|nr:hypothetical protein LY76DRAFT_388571 [Colletotrichum caudatum]